MLDIPTILNGGGLILAIILTGVMVLFLSDRSDHDDRDKRAGQD